MKLSPESVVIATVNLFASDVDRLASFYLDLLALQERKERRTAIFRSLLAGSVQLGINGPAVFDLLGIASRRPAESDGPRPAHVSFTFEVPEKEAVDIIAARVESSGGQLVKPPFMSAYGAWQAVIADPEGNVFRISCRL